MSHVNVSDGSIMPSDIQYLTETSMASLTLFGDVRHCRIRDRILAGFILGYYICP